MREYVQVLMSKSGPADLLDSVLVVANICEQRVLMATPVMRQWYAMTATILRGALDILAFSDKCICPLDKLEDPLLYFPHTTLTH